MNNNNCKINKLDSKMLLLTALYININNTLKGSNLK